MSQWSQRERLIGAAGLWWAVALLALWSACISVQRQEPVVDAAGDADALVASDATDGGGGDEADTSVVSPDALAFQDGASDAAVDGDVAAPPAGPARLCWPCQADGDCQDAGLGCVRLGPSTGAFCLLPCAAGCLDGAVCAAASLEGGGDGDFCVPAGLGCACPADARAAGASTLCTDPIGCLGARTCGAEGLGDCAASAPRTEVAEGGVDDDCDGETDEAPCQCGDGFCDAGGCAETWQTCSDDCGDRCSGRASCDDDRYCTKDLCEEGGTCVNTVTPGYCLIDGLCHVDGDQPEGEPCLVCKAASPAKWSPADGAACDDGDSCTVGDACNGALCQGAPKECGDELACTVDTCAGGACEHALAAGSCLVADQCVGAGQTAPGSAGCIVCDPANATHDWTATSGGLCDDGKACTEDDECSQGLCAGVPIDCDDGHGCTVDACVGGVCANEPAGGKCLIAEHCYDGGDVNPSDPCELCDPLAGAYAWSWISGAACDDGSDCTEDDTCWLDGVCEGDPVPDAWEQVIDTAFYAELIGETQDTVSTTQYHVFGTINPSTDVDWYAFIDSDTADPKQPIPLVELTTVPTGMSLKVCLLYECDKGSLVTPNCQTAGAQSATIDGLEGCCWSGQKSGASLSMKPQCTQIDDGGLVYVGLQRDGGLWSCEEYRFDWGDGVIAP